MTCRLRKLPVSAGTRQIFSSAFIFQHRPEISRVIFLSASHRGADMATGFGGRLLSKIIGGNPTAPGLAGEQAKAISLMKPDFQRRQTQAHTEQASTPSGRETVL